MANLKLPRLNAIVLIVDSQGKRTPAFLQFWDKAMSAIETNENGLAVTLAQITDILNGTAEFSAININGVMVATVGTSAGVDIGTAGAKVPLLSTANTWSQIVNSVIGYAVGGIKVVGARVVGWTASTGAALIGAFNANKTQIISAAYVQAELQTVQDDLLAARQRIKGLEDALRSHGLIN